MECECYDHNFPSLRNSNLQTSDIILPSRFLRHSSNLHFAYNHLFHLSLLWSFTCLMISYQVVRFYGYGLCLWYSDWYSVIYLYRKHCLILQYKYLATSACILQFNIDQVHSSHLLCDFFGTPILCLVRTSTWNLHKYLLSLSSNRTPWRGRCNFL